MLRFVWNNGSFMIKLEKHTFNTVLGFRQRGVIKSVDFLVRLPGRLKTWAKQYDGNFFLSDTAGCVLLTQFIWFLQFLYLLCCCEILVTKKIIMFYGYCGIEGAIISDLSHSDRYFSHARPGRIGYRTFASNTVRADTRSYVNRTAPKWFECGY